jgi:hypothetical protein
LFWAEPLSRHEPWSQREGEREMFFGTEIENVVSTIDAILVQATTAERVKGARNALDMMRKAIDRRIAMIDEGSE